MTDRVGVLRQYQFSWPAFDWALAVTALRALLLLLVLGGIVWLLSLAFGRLTRAVAAPDPSQGVLER
jgi:hypothetical protein